MKRVIALFSIIILIISFSLTAFSVELNGVDEGSEWYGSTVIRLLDGESNCKVNFGLLKAKFDNETNALYLCFMFSEPDLSSDNTNTGLSLIIEDSEPFVITMNSSTVEYDVDKYSYNGAILIDENYGTTCEIRLGLKYGLPAEINGSVRFIDSDGSPSNFYHFTIENETHAETEIVAQKPVDITEKSTKKTSVTKETSNKTSAPKTTKSEKITFPDFDFLFDNESTVTDTQPAKTKTSTEKSTGTKTNKKEKSTVKIIEKEIYISVVTQPVADDSLTTDTTTIISDNADNGFKSSISLSDGSKYKTITAVFGGIALVTVAVLGTLSSKRKDNENDPKS